MPNSSSTHGSRIRAAFRGLAVCDALGGPAEFKARGSFDLVTTMIPNDNFSLPPGSFTDDTSQALCLTHSLIDHHGRHDTYSQVGNYLKWRKHAFLSATDKCFDVGASTDKILEHWVKLLASNRSRSHAGISATTVAAEKIQGVITSTYSASNFCGNGSLMRVLPCALIAKTEDQAIALAKSSSLPTHPNQLCVDACTLYTTLVFRALQGADKPTLAKVVADFFSQPTPKGSLPINSKLRSRLKPYTNLEAWQAKPSDQISSSGYVLDTIEAALWGFFTTDTFREGAIKVVNLGNDADTVGAIYGGLAGAFYGENSSDDKGVPKDWWDDMTKKCRKLIDEAVEGILKVKEEYKSTGN